MVSRIHFDDEQRAVAAADALDDAGLEVALIQERFAGEDDDEALDYVVATPEGAARVRELLADLLDEEFVEED